MYAMNRQRVVSRAFNSIFHLASEQAEHQYLQLNDQKEYSPWEDISSKLVNLNLLQLDSDIQLGLESQQLGPEQLNRKPSDVMLAQTDSNPDVKTKVTMAAADTQESDDQPNATDEGPKNIALHHHKKKT